MPLYVVEGKGTKSGRARGPRTYRAKTREAAISKAKQDGTTAERVELVEVAHFVDQVAGASHKNSDNTSRQRIIQSSHVPERLVLVHEEGNRHDKHATKVLRTNGEQLGYLPKYQADPLIEDFYEPSGCLYSAFSIGRERMSDTTDLVTLRICVFMALPTAQSETVKQYVAKVLQELGAELRPEHATPTTPLESQQRLTQQRPKPQTPGAPPIRATPSRKSQSGCLVVVAMFLFLIILAF